MSRYEVRYAGQIFSFEPVPELARRLTERAKEDRLWQVYNVALGASTNTLSLNVMKDTVFSSFLDPTTASVSEFADYNVLVRKQDVEVFTLDHFVEEHQLGNRQPLYLKIDTQGFDLEVLKGAARSLRIVRALQTELSVTPIYQDMPNYLDMLSYLHSAGFRPSGFFPVSRTREHTLIETDCCMVNRLLS